MCLSYSAGMLYIPTKCKMTDICLFCTKYYNTHLYKYNMLCYINRKLFTLENLSHLKEELAWAVDKQLRVISTIVFFKKQL